MIKKIGISYNIMRLKKLEISGFKSFAHKTDLEFPTAISAIVGPNGSGKSNVVDAVRWVLGEQSFKNLRSKSGADLIWSGSQTKPAQGKASASLHFDNSDGFFPVDFEELVIGRKVYRDGASEYYLNSSPVRLKDIVGLLARSKLGLRGHSIVNQGSADEILKASPEERRGILEEALGLREFQLKKSEAESKLSDTSANLIKTGGLLNEIFPHLRSLKRQVDKFKNREGLVDDLNNLENRYFTVKIQELFARKNKNQEEKTKLAEKIAALRADFEAKERLFETQTDSISHFGENTKPIEDDLNKLNSEHQNIMRELGRVEGFIESAERNGGKNTKTVEAVLAVKIKYWAKRLNAALELSDAGDIKKIIKNLAGEVQIIGNYFEKNEINKILSLANFSDLEETYENPYEKDREELKMKLEKLDGQIKLAQSAMLKIRQEENNWRADYLARQKELELARRGYVLAEEAMRKFDLEEEKIKLIESDLKSEMWSAEKKYDEFLEAPAADAGISEPAFAELQNKIIKLRREIADIGNVDEEIMREYEETSKRHEFLTKETGDLNNATESLKNLIKDLNIRINNDFKAGMGKINEEFNHYFRLIFGGGAAKLNIDNLNGGPSSPAGEIGANININIPQKRIKDLNLLSGGERSLVSIALIFAIVSASRPPFLILDEIDAALDEVNAARFAKILKDLAKDIQFVLITHNRATMEAAQVLYGITMGSDGVSKMFSLKLEQAAL